MISSLWLLIRTGTKLLQMEHSSHQFLKTAKTCYSAVFLLLALSAMGCTSAVSNKVSVDYYSISGNSTAELDKQIKAKGPIVNGGRHAVAVARIRMIPDIQFGGITSGSSEVCKVTKAKVNVNARVTLPRWTGRRGASSQLGKAWDKIDKYTRLHEAAHVSIAFKYAQRMENELAKLSDPLPCPIVRAKAKLIVDEYLSAHDKEQREFDASEQMRFAEFARKQNGKKS